MVYLKLVVNTFDNNFNIVVLDKFNKLEGKPVLNQEISFYPYLAVFNIFLQPQFDVKSYQFLIRLRI